MNKPTALAGEGSTGTIAQVSGRRKPRRAEEWVWVFQGHLRQMACDRRLKGAHWRVLAYMMSCVTFAQDLVIRQAEVGGALGMAPQAVSRLLRDLDQLGIVLRVKQGEIPATYRLNSQYIYKGRGERLEQRRAYQGKERRRG